MLSQNISSSLGLPFLSQVSDHAVYVADTAGHIQFWNPGASHLFGWQESQVMNQHGWDDSFIFPPEEQARGAGEKERLRALGEGLVAEERWYIHRNGSRFLGHSILLPLHDAADTGRTKGTVRWFLRVISDVTAHARQREQLETVLHDQQRVYDLLQSSQLPTLLNEKLSGMSLAALYHPIRPEDRVGGDFYDALCLEDGSIALFVGDASGKGLAAATRATEVRYSLRAFLREDTSPGNAVTRVNAMLCRCADLELRERNVFTALTLVVISPDRRQIKHIHAGGEYPLLLRADGSNASEFEEGSWGSVLGVVADQQYMATTAALYPNDLLLLFTDGLTEARRSGRFFGTAGIDDSVRAFLRGKEPSSVNAKKIADEVMTQTLRFGGAKTSDDICLMVAMVSP